MASKLFFERANFDPFGDTTIEMVVKLTDSQKEIWSSCTSGDIGANLAYNESIRLDLVGDVDKSLFIRAFEEIIKRHEALRTTFSADGEDFIVYEDLMPSVAF